MSTVTTFSPPTVTIQRSPWHSPVPYLFGGLAAMLGLMAFALLVLACSYWNLSGLVDDNRENDDTESGDQKIESNKAVSFPVLKENVLVIMAGNVKPTFLATRPVLNKAVSLVDGKENSFANIEKNDHGRVEKPIEVIISDDQASTRTTTVYNENSEAQLR